jgi:hypothetical protein
MTSSDRQEKYTAMGKSNSVSRQGQETQRKCSCKAIGRYQPVPGPSKAQYLLHLLVDFTLLKLCYAHDV